MHLKGKCVPANNVVDGELMAKPVDLTAERKGLKLKVDLSRAPAAANADQVAT